MKGRERLLDSMKKSSPSPVVRTSDKPGDIPGGKRGLRLLDRHICYVCMSLGGGRGKKTPEASGTGTFLLPEAQQKSMCVFERCECLFVCCVDEEVHPPGPYVPSAVCGVVLHGCEQSGIHLCYVLPAHDRVWGAVGTHAGIHTHPDG